MSDADKPGSGDFGTTGPIDLERAEPEAGVQDLACANCSLPIADVYFTAGSAIVCERCRGLVEQELLAASGAARFVRASALGLGAAALGSAIWLTVVTLTGYELGIIAIVVGFLVGGAVRMGTRGRGGVGYQLLAVGLTYLSIVSSYVPWVIQGLEQGMAEEALAVDPESGLLEGDEAGLGRESPGLGDPIAEATAPVAPEETTARQPEWTVGQTIAFYAFVLALAAAAPFLAGLENLIGLLIIGFALWQAWKMNAFSELEFGGPFRVGDAPV